MIDRISKQNSETKFLVGIGNIILMKLAALNRSLLDICAFGFALCDYVMNPFWLLDIKFFPYEEEALVLTSLEYKWRKFCYLS